MNIKKIKILLCFLSLVAFISCSAEDKTGSPNPGDTVITGGNGNGENEVSEPKTFASYAGDWWGSESEGAPEKHMFTINADGSLTWKGKGVSDMQVP